MGLNRLSGVVGAAFTSVAAVVSAVGLIACTSDSKVAGVSTVETENAYVIQVLDEGGDPVVNASAVLRVADYLPSLNALNKSVQQVKAVAKEFTSDSAGYIRMELFEDSLTLEVLDGNRGAFVELFAENIQKGGSAELTLNRLGVLSGKVELPEGEDFAWVRIYGTDRVVKTDGDGNYEIEGLAPADYRVQTVVADTDREEVKTVKSSDVEKSSSSLRSESSSSGIPESSSSALGYLDVLDFENGLKSNIVFDGDSSTLYLKPTDTSLVKMSPGEYEAELSIVEAGAGREGHAMHWTSSAEKGRWSFMGLWMCSSTKPCDFSAIDSIEYFVRGTGSYSFNLETIADGSTGKAVFLDTLQGADEWERVVIKPSDFMKGDSTYGNMGWDYVSKRVTNIAVPAYYDVEIWIDDIKFYGVSKDDL